MGRSRWMQAAALVGFLAAVFAVAGAGGLFTSRAVEQWYPSLARPSWTPPSWLFGPVWTVLYALMAVAAWLIWRSPPSPARRAGLAFFAIQLVLNAAWSPVFFGLQSPAGGLAVIVPLLAGILLTVVWFWRVRRLAGAMLLPYLAWTAFATALNTAIWWLNR